MDDRSLDDFLGSADDEEAEATADHSSDDGEEQMADTGGGETGADDVETGDEGSADDDKTVEVSVDPAVPTSRWSQDGLACPDCGTTVSRLWTEDGAAVCRACKEW